MSSGWATPPAEPPPLAARRGRGLGDGEEEGEDEVVEEKLRDFLDGRHSFDEMRLALRVSARELVERLGSGRFGEVLVFNK